MDEQETAFVQDLIAGKGFHQFIVASTVSLITSSLEITDSTVPETFLLDTHRITMFRGEIDNLVAMATVLVSAAQNIGMPSPAKRLVSFFWVFGIATYYCSNPTPHRRSPSSPPPFSNCMASPLTIPRSWTSSTRSSTSPESSSRHRRTRPGFAGRSRSTWRRRIQCASSCEFFELTLYY